jgi:two-component system sensor histidine kinase KdpD
MQSNTKHGASSYIIAIFLLAILTLSSTPLLHYFDLANIVMVFLLVVFLVAEKLGRGPAIMSAVHPMSRSGRLIFIVMTSLVS